MSQYLIDQIEGTDNIDVRTQCEVSAVHGTDGLETIDVTNNATGTTETMHAAALFLFIGAKPHTDFLGESSHGTAPASSSPARISFRMEPERRDGH